MDPMMMDTTTVATVADTHGSHKMYFHVGHHEFVLFHEAETQSVGAIVVACVISFIVGVLYHGLKTLREWLHKRALLKAYPKRGGQYLDDCSTEKHQGQVVVVQERTACGSMFSGEHVIQSLLHMVQMFVSYCLMLVFMTYNIWLCISIVLGAGVGYLVFGWISPRGGF